MAYIADKIEVVDERVVFEVSIETQASGSAQAAAARAEAAAGEAESAMVGKLDTDKNPALLKFNYVGGSETNDPVLAPSMTGWDQVFREIGNTITLGDGRRIMVYTGYVLPYHLSYIGIAVSTDYGPFEKKGLNGDGQLTFTPSEDPFLVEKDGVFYLYVEKKESGSIHLDIQLFTATSIEALLIGNLTDHGVVLSSEPDSWESQDVSSPTVLIKDGIFILIYEGRSLAGNSGAAGLAYSADGINFVKSTSNPIASGTQLNSDLKWASHLVPNDIIFQNGLYYLTVHAYNSVTFAGGVLVSADLVTWRDYLGTWVSREDGSDNFGSGMMFHFEEKYKQIVVHYLGDLGIMKGYLTIMAKTVSSSGGGFVEKDGNVGLGTTDPQRKLEISGPKNTSILRLTSTTNDSGWVAGDIYGSLEFASKDGSTGGAGVLASVKCIDDARTASGNWSIIAFAIRQPIGGVGLRDVIYIKREGDLVPVADGSANLGLAANRWATVYATTGAISTSDANEKTDVEEINNTEKATAALIKQKIKKFRFRDSVSDKGDAARIHFGVIAQEVEEAFIVNGLDPRQYGLFCEDFWHTKSVDGESVYTDIDDPDAVEHVRLGIRYDELLCFIISSI